MTPGQTCETCKAYSAINANGGAECRKKSPTAVVMPGPGGQVAKIGVYPPTNKDGWCCEWEPNEEVRKKQWVTT